MQQRRWMNSANIMDLRQLFINLSWVNSKMRVFLYIIQLLRWVEFNAGLGICFGKATLPSLTCAWCNWLLHAANALCISSCCARSLQAVLSCVVLLIYNLAIVTHAVLLGDTYPMLVSVIDSS